MSGLITRARPAAVVVVVCGVVAGLVILLLPLALVAVPPLLDYPNHLARLWLIVQGPLGPPLSDIYAVDWSLAVTNIGIDLLALVLGPSIGADAVGRLSIALALALPVLGAIAFGRVVAGRWHVAMLALPPLAWNLPFALGFLNNQIAAGAALAVAALVAASRVAGLARAVLLAASGAAVAVIHPFGAMLLGGLMAALAAGPNLPRRHELWATTWRAAMGAAPVVLGVGLLLVLAPARPGADARFATSLLDMAYTPALKSMAVLSPFITYFPIAEAALALVLILAVYLGLRQGWLRAHGGLLVLAVALFVASAVTPSTIGDTGFIDIRPSAMALFVLAAALAPAAVPGRRVVVACALGALALGAVRSAAIHHEWQLASRDLVAVERAIAHLPPGVALMSAEAGPPQMRGHDRHPWVMGMIPTYWHFPLRAVELRAAFVPTFFAFDGRQPVAVREPWRIAAAPMHPLPFTAWLRDPDEDMAVRADYPRIAEWRADFRYLLVINAGFATAQTMPEGLDLVADEGFARLYRVR